MGNLAHSPTSVREASTLLREASTLLRDLRGLRDLRDLCGLRGLRGLRDLCGLRGLRGLPSVLSVLFETCFSAQWATCISGPISGLFIVLPLLV